MPYTSQILRWVYFVDIILIWGAILSSVGILVAVSSNPHSSIYFLWNSDNSHTLGKWLDSLPCHRTWLPLFSVPFLSNKLTPALCSWLTTSQWMTTHIFLPEMLLHTWQISSIGYWRPRQCIAWIACPECWICVCGAKGLLVGFKLKFFKQQKKKVDHIHHRSVAGSLYVEESFGMPNIIKKKNVDCISEKWAFVSIGHECKCDRWK